MIDYAGRVPDRDPIWLAAAVAVSAQSPRSRASDRIRGDAASAADHPATVIGPYKLLQEIDEGGMGVVWVAEQEPCN